tara:strand:+ start:78 stop:284 length:207 start_codon:yes stop_codon:yes gene_type:complete
MIKDIKEIKVGSLLILREKMRTTNRTFIVVGSKIFRTEIELYDLQYNLQINVFSMDIVNSQYWDLLSP